MSVTLNLTNNGKTVSLNLHNGRKGNPFTYEDFTPEQLEALKLKFEDLSPEEKAELEAAVTKENIESAIGGEPTLKSEVGIDVILAGTNILSEAASISFSDTSFWGTGFLNGIGTISPDVNFRRTVDYIKAYPGSYSVYLPLYGLARIHVFDENYNFLFALDNPTESDIPNYTIELPEGTAFIKICTPSTTNHTLIKADLQNNYYITTSNIFTKPEYVDKSIAEVREDLGVIVYEVGSNIIPSLSQTDILNTDIWGGGYFNSQGGISTNDVNYYYTRNYYSVTPGEFHLTANFGFGAKAILYDKNFNQISVISNPSSSNSFNSDIAIPSGASYIRLSHNKSVAVSSIRLATYSEVEIRQNTFYVSNLIKEENKYDPINGFAVSSVMKDIFRKTTPTKTRTPIVSFIADHVNLANNTDEWYIPVLDSKGIKATFAIITSRFDSGSDVTKEQVVTLSREGHDIAGHSHTHANLSSITIEEAEDEIRKCKMSLLALNESADMFVAPFGARTVEVDKIIRKYFSTDFIDISDSGFFGEYSNTPPINSYFLKRVNFDALYSGSPDPNNRINFLKSTVDEAVLSGGWLVFGIHPHTYDEYSPTANPSGFQTRRDELGLLIDYIQSLDVPILTANQAFDFYKNKVEIGNIDLDDNYYALGMDGTEDDKYFI